MEVLDTTVANVALRYIAGGLVGRGLRQRVGHHELPGRECDHRADLRLAGGAPRPPQLLPAFHRRVHDQFRPLRHGHQSLADHPLPRHAGPGGRRAAAVQPGHLARLLSAGEAGGRDDALRRRGLAGARRRARRSAVGSRSNTNGAGSSTSTCRSGCSRWWLVTLLVEDPDYLKAERAAAGRQKVRFDTIGLGLLVIAMASWEVVLSKGQEWDWFGDPFWPRADAWPCSSCLAWAG